MSPVRPALLALALAACTDTGKPVDLNENEVITTVTLTFTPTGGGDALVFAWDDPEGDGSPRIDAVVLSDADDYDLAVGFANELADPVEDVTADVEAESDQHQLFLTGTGVEGPAGTGDDAVITWAYADDDANGLPVGLATDVTTAGPGAGTLIVTLRHLPPESGVPTKVAGLAEQVAADGFGALPGSTDAQVTFPLTVR